jgi:hypothetical protein
MFNNCLTTACAQPRGALAAATRTVSHRSTSSYNPTVTGSRETMHIRCPKVPDTPAFRALGSNEASLIII